MRAHFFWHVPPNCFVFIIAKDVYSILTTEYYAKQNVNVLQWPMATVLFLSFSFRFSFCLNNWNQCISEKNGDKRNQIWSWYSVIPMIRCKFIQSNVRVFIHSWHVWKRPSEKNHRIREANKAWPGFSQFYVSPSLCNCVWFLFLFIFFYFFFHFLCSVWNGNFCDKNQFLAGIDSMKYLNSPNTNVS